MNFNLKFRSMKHIPNIQQRLIIKRYSPSTVRTYLTCLKNLFTYFKNHNTETLSKEELLNYLEYLVQKGYSKSAQNQHINAIKFYYEKYLEKEKQYYFICLLYTSDAADE